MGQRAGIPSVIAGLAALAALAAAGAAAAQDGRGQPAPARPAPPGFSLGVSAAEVTSTSARLWTRPDRIGRVRLDLSRSETFSRPVLRRRLRARLHDDRTVQTIVRNLQPGTRYRYRFVRRSRRGVAVSDVGTFATAPPPDADVPVSFAVSGDADAQPAPGQSVPHWNDFGIYRLMAADGNAFNVNLGDTIYSDSEVPVWPGVPDALTVEQKWQKYRQNIAQPALKELRRSGVVYSHWDDHEFINDFSRFESEFSTGNDTEGNKRTIRIDGQALYPIGVRAFRDYMPVTYTGRLGIYRTFRWGRHLEVFLLDERSFRSAKASADGACDNPNSGDADYAPTAEGTVARTTFGLLISGVRGPVSQRCKDTIRSPDRTFLGRAQLERFMADVKASSATWKVILSEDPIQQYYVLPYDRWEGYEHERQRVLRFLVENVRNVAFVTTDVHANFVNDVRFQTLEPGGPVNSGITEFVTGPVATKSYGREIDDEVGRPGVGFAVATTVFKPPPPQGVGMRCAQVDQFSYARVTATRETLRVELKDIQGETVRDVDGVTPCGPYEIRAR